MKTLKEKQREAQQRRAQAGYPIPRKPSPGRGGVRTMADIERMLRFIFDKPSK